VLQSLRENKLHAKFDKCDFYQRKVQYLGNLISEDGIAVILEKIRAIMEWIIPKDVAYIRSFMRIMLGMCYIICMCVCGHVRFDN
jgi:hypothetical protein